MARLVLTSYHIHLIRLQFDSFILNNYEVGQYVESIIKSLKRKKNRTDGQRMAEEAFPLASYLKV